MRKNKQVNFMVGDKWLYYKIFAGPNTSDKLLLNELSIICEKLIYDNYISKWFFIRYSHPSFHLRLRLELINKDKYYDIIKLIFENLNPLLQDYFINDIEISVYKRETQRYGLSTIEYAENIFYIDSVIITKALKILEETDNPKKNRWLTSFLIMEMYFDLFQCDSEDRLRMLGDLKLGYYAEFKVKHYTKKQLNEKYRINKENIRSVMGGNYTVLSFLETDVFLKLKFELKQSVDEILKQKKYLNTEIFDSYILSYIHMSLNRLFSSKNRVHELICYDFIHREYATKRAKSNSNKLITNLKHVKTD